MSIIQFTASLPYITSSLSELHSGCKWILPNFLSIILLFSPLGQKMLLFGILYLSLQGCKLSFLFCSFSSEVTSQLWVQNWGSEQGMCIHPSSSAPNVSGGKPSDAQSSDHSSNKGISRSGMLVQTLLAWLTQVREKRAFTPSHPTSSLLKLEILTL